jgi:uncharacterized protein (TIGR03067 family)
MPRSLPSCVALALFVGAVPFAAPAARAADDAELLALKGTWEISVLTINGKEQSSDGTPQEITFFPKKGRFKCDDGAGDDDCAGVLTIDTGVQPHTLRMVFDSKGHNGQDYRLIYKIEGDTLTVATLEGFGGPGTGKEPPRGFGNKKANVITYKRK